jgi:hypothetical protein
MSSNQQLFRRGQARSEVSGSMIKGLVQTKHSRAKMALNLANISDGGLCIASAISFKTGEMLTLTISHPAIFSLSCNVQWCKKSEDGKSYMIGLHAHDNNNRLAALHNEIIACQRIEETSESEELAAAS